MNPTRLALLALVLAAPALAANVDDATLHSIQVTSARSSSWAEFNMPAVRLWLPRADASAYADVEFAAPKLVDAGGHAVAGEVEHGIYDPDRWETEIRLDAKGEAARVSGSIHLRYPTRMRPATASDRDDDLTEPALGLDLPKVVVEQWKEVDITYDLPIVAKLPDSKKGETEPVSQKITATPGGKVVVTVKP
jgi:hypothetical protein